MKTFRVYYYKDPSRGIGVGGTFGFFKATNEDELKFRLENQFGKHYYIDLGYVELEESQRKAYIEKYQKFLNQLLKQVL